MHRTPEPKSQARILAKAFAHHGVKLAHRQALDVVAQMNGFSSWQAMQALAKPTEANSDASGAKAVRPRQILSRAQDFAYTFEAVGFANHRKNLHTLQKVDAQPFYDQVSLQLKEMGFTGLLDVSMNEDDGQDDTDIKMFIVVQLRGPANLLSETNMPNELVYALELISRAVRCNQEGLEVVEAYDWVLSSGPIAT